MAKKGRPRLKDELLNDFLALMRAADERSSADLLKAVYNARKAVEQAVKGAGAKITAEKKELGNGVGAGGGAGAISESKLLEEAAGIEARARELKDAPEDSPSPKPGTENAPAASERRAEAVKEKAQDDLQSVVGSAIVSASQNRGMVQRLQKLLESAKAHGGDQEIKQAKEKAQAAVSELGDGVKAMVAAAVQEVDRGGSAEIKTGSVQGEKAKLLDDLDALANEVSALTGARAKLGAAPGGPVPATQ